MVSKIVRKVCILTSLFLLGFYIGFREYTHKINRLYHTDRQENEILRNTPYTPKFWTYSYIGFVIIFGTIVTASLTHVVGRRFAVTILSVLCLVGNILLFFTLDTTISIFMKISDGVSLIMFLLLCILIGEYTTTSQRLLYMILIASIAPSLGNAIASIAIFYNVGLVSAILGTSLLVVIASSTVLWVESPSWLAYNGKFALSEECFKSLHDDVNELKILTRYEGFRYESKRKNREMFGDIVKTSYFWRVTVILVNLIVYKSTINNILLSFYGYRMGLEYAFLIMMALQVLGRCLSLVVLIKSVKTTTFLFSSCLLSIIVLISLCITYSLLELNSVPVLICILAFSLSVNVAYSFIVSFIGEVIPLQLKSYSFFLYGGILLASEYAFTEILSNFSLSTLLIINLITMAFCLMFLWCFLPETKGKCLQEIELYFKNGRYTYVDDLLADSPEDSVPMNQQPLRT